MDLVPHGVNPNNFQMVVNGANGYAVLKYLNDNYGQQIAEYAGGAVRNVYDNRPTLAAIKRGRFGTPPPNSVGPNNNAPPTPGRAYDQIEMDVENNQQIVEYPANGFLPSKNMTTVAAPAGRIRKSKGSKKTRKTKAKGKKKAYKKKAKKAVKRRKPKKKLPGFTNCTVIENGGVINDPQCTYIGHALAVRQIMAALSRSLVHKLYQTNGVDLISFDEVPLNNTSTAIKIYFRLRSTTSVAAMSQYSITATVNGTYNQISVALAAEMFLRMTEASELYDMWLTTDSNDDDATKSVLQFQNMTFNFHMSSVLKIQNTTEAASATDPLLGTNISANPLCGKRYTKKATGFVPTFRGTGAEASYVPFIADASFGLINANNLHSAVTQSIKPPAGSFFEARATNVLMKPGDIIIDKLSYSFKKSPQELIRKMRGSFTSDANLHTSSPVGEAHMFGLERLIDCRVAEPVIKISYQLDQTYKASIVYRKKKVIAPMLAVGTTAFVNP